MLCIRYVDNRLVLIPRNQQTLNGFRKFLDLDFYDPPVELEPCGDNKFLGYELDLLHGTCKYVVPKESFHYRSPRSAGTPSRILSGFQARLHLLYRGTFPSQEVKPLIEELVQGYLNQGFARPQLSSMIFRVSSRYVKRRR